MIELRDYQNKLVDEIRKQLKAGYTSIASVLPTGGGKTAIFGYIVQQMALNNKRVNILVHRKELLDQTSRHLDRLGVEHGCIAPGHTMTGDNIQVSSVQTLVNRLENTKNYDAIIVDECHHSRAGTWAKILNHYNSLILGFTATPIRLDGAGLGIKTGGFFQKIVEGPQIYEMVPEWLCRPIMYGSKINVDFSDVGLKGSDYDANQISDLIDNPVVTGNAVDEYIEKSYGKPAIAFCQTVEHAVHVSDAFNRSGIPSMCIDGNLDKKTRQYAIDSLANGRLMILTNCGIISEGTDIPVVTTCIMLRRTLSLGLYLQMVGRVLRKYPGKENAIVLDHVGNILLHGSPLEHREWSLDTPKKTKKELLEEKEEKWIQCNLCAAWYPTTLKKCSECGLEKQKKARSLLDEVEGKLVRLDEEELSIIKKIQRREIGKARSLDQLKEVAKQRGYHPQWANRIYHSRKRGK